MANIGYMPEDRRLVPRLSVEQNVLLPAWSAGIPDAAARLASVYRAIPEVGEWRARKALHLSGGQQKLVALARAMMAGTRLLLLDEPFEGVAPVLARRLAGIYAHAGRVGHLPKLCRDCRTVGGARGRDGERHYDHRVVRRHVEARSRRLSVGIDRPVKSEPLLEGERARIPGGLHRFELIYQHGESGQREVAIDVARRGGDREESERTEVERPRCPGRIVAQLDIGLHEPPQQDRVRIDRND